MTEENRKRARDEDGSDSEEENPLPKNDPDREPGSDVEPTRPRSTRRCAQNRKPITEEPTDSEEEGEGEEGEDDQSDEEEAEEEYDSDDYQADNAGEDDDD